MIRHWRFVEDRANLMAWPLAARKLTTHDKAIAAMLSAIRELMNPPAPKRRGIGFTADLGLSR